MVGVSCAVDWAAVADVLGGLGGLAAGAATVALAIYARRGLTAWKTQVKGTRRIELIEEILTHAYEVEEVFKYMTHPFSTGAEHAKVERLENESEEDWQRRAPYLVGQLRFNEHKDAFAKLRAVAFRAKAVLGKEAWEALTNLIVLPRSHMNLAVAVYRQEQRLRQLQRQRDSGVQVEPLAINQAMNTLSEVQNKYYGITPGSEPELQMAALVSALERELAKPAPSD